MRTIQSRLAAILAAIAILATALPLALPSAAAPGDASMSTVTGVAVDPYIAELWQAIDGPVAENTVARAWTWGPNALAATVEYAADSPTGVRRMVYFDKGRMDILEEAEAADSDWYVTGALLVTQMISGRIPFAEGGVVTRPAPAIPVAGDLDQPNPLTYGMLVPLASVFGVPLTGEVDVLFDVPEPSIGMEVSALITPDGAVVADGMPNLGVRVAAYDDVTGHNIAAPFVDWAGRQPVHPVWLTGRPLTEPYWTETIVGGDPTLVLVQAFERRILTYTPSQAPGWRVESNNAGQHYRLWRGLNQPGETAQIALASGEPFGEEIVGAALAREVDPFLLAAIAQVSSGGYPLASQTNGGVGLLAVRPEVASELGGGDLYDPRLNALLAATELRRADRAREDNNATAILTDYYAGNREDVDVAALVASTLTTYSALLDEYPADGTTPPIGNVPGSAIGSGAAAYYSPSYDRAWWEKTMRFYAGFGMVTENWEYDPNGYYCVKPGYIPGQRLRLVANGVEITCTIGDTVAAGDVANWKKRWAVELNWDAFIALGLDKHNQVDVFHLGAVG